MNDKRFVVGQLAGPGDYRCEACSTVTSVYDLSFEIEPCLCGGESFVRID